VFADGRLIASHAYRQIARGGGGGSSIKESVDHPIVRSHLGRIGEHLHWHGALSVDYIVDRPSGTPYYFDCNPRLIEPMSAVLAGLDLVDVLLRVSRGEATGAAPGSASGVRTHPARVLAAPRQARSLCRMQGRADAGGARLDELRAADGHRALAAGDAGRRAYASGEGMGRAAADTANDPRHQGHGRRRLSMPEINISRRQNVVSSSNFQLYVAVLFSVRFLYELFSCRPQEIDAQERWRAD
jgi:hypothetical protein